jgi:hypothetical protein
LRENAEGTVSREELDARLSRPEELSGLLNKALDAFAKIRSSGFTQSESMMQAWSEFRCATDPLSVWLDAHTEEDPDAVTPKEKLLAPTTQHAGPPDVRR